MLITIVGAGFIGSVSAVCFCEFGFEVHLIDQNKTRLSKLKSGKATRYESGVNDLLRKHLKLNSIKLFTNISDETSKSIAIFIAIPTTAPSGGDINLEPLGKLVEEISFCLSKEYYIGIFIKTNVPLGTCRTVADNVKFFRQDLVPGKHYDIIYNPSFIRDGTAIQDFMMPNRLAIGLNSKVNSIQAKKLVEEVYSTLLNLDVPFVYGNYESIELMRLASIGFIVTKMAFINEIAELCDKTGADVDVVIRGMSLDKRIGRKGLNVTPGVGGSSYPKAVRSISSMGKMLGLKLDIINGVLESNNSRSIKIKNTIINLICNINSSKKKIAIWGLSSKALSDDIKESLSVLVIYELLKENVIIDIYDPNFQPKSQSLELIPDELLLNERIHIANSAYDASGESCIIVIMTDWPQFRSLYYDKIYELMDKVSGNKPIILDYRNMFSKQDLQKFNYISHGHGSNTSV